MNTFLPIAFFIFIFIFIFMVIAISQYIKPHQKRRWWDDDGE